MPASTPQMSDPRIIVQTYNPPSKDALPIKLAPPAMKFNLIVPKPKQQTVINDIHYLGKIFIMLVNFRKGSQRCKEKN